MSDFAGVVEILPVIRDDRARHNRHAGKRGLRAGVAAVAANLLLAEENDGLADAVLSHV